MKTFEVWIKSSYDKDTWYNDKIGTIVTVKEPYDGSWGYECVETGYSIYRHDAVVCELGGMTVAGWLPDDAQVNDNVLSLYHVRVVKDFDGCEICWPGSHKNVVRWALLENGKFIGFNENVEVGWSFPVLGERAVRNWYKKTYPHRHINTVLPW